MQERRKAGTTSEERWLFLHGEGKAAGAEPSCLVADVGGGKTEWWWLGYYSRAEQQTRMGPEMGERAGGKEGQIRERAVQGHGEVRTREGGSGARPATLRSSHSSTTGAPLVKTTCNAGMSCVQCILRNDGYGQARTNTHRKEERERESAPETQRKNSQ